MGPIDPLVETIAGMILGGREHWEHWVSHWKELPTASVLLAGKALISPQAA
jgi:hypothetical protein